MIKKSYLKGIVGLGLTVLLAMTPAAFASSGEHGGGHGEGGHGGTSAKQMSSSETIKEVISGNDQFRAHHGRHYFDAYQKGQTPNLTVITCADSRVHTSLFGMDPYNNIFIIRNIGNQIVNSEGSVDYGVLHLPTRILLVMGHSSCGAVKAAMGDYSGESEGIKAELDTLKPVLTTDVEGQFKARWDRNVEINVDHQVKYAMGLYSQQIAAGKLAVVGGVYDFNNNYGRGRGMLVITNVNGETDINKIMHSPVLKELTDAELVNHVGTLAPGQ